MVKEEFEEDGNLSSDEDAEVQEIGEDGKAAKEEEELEDDEDEEDFVWVNLPSFTASIWQGGEEELEF